MRPARLLVAIREDLRRGRGHFLLSAIGIVVGIAAFTFFLGLGRGVRDVVLHRIFPIDQLEVVPRSMDVDVGPLRMGLGRDALDDAGVERLAALDGVVAAFPKMKLTVPATVAGGESILGSDVTSEIVVDGIDPQLVADDVAPDRRFETRAEAPAKACRTDAECGGAPAFCGGPPDARSCRTPIPVIASHHLVELYNGAFRRAHGFPKLNPEFALGATLRLDVGDSMVARSARKRITTERLVLVGFSERAIPLGLTMPIEHVRRLNRDYDPADADDRYHSVVLQLASGDVAAAVIEGVRQQGFDVAGRRAEQAAVVLAVVVALLTLVSVAIVSVAALSISHTFFMLIYQRQRDLGIMRAVGATRGDIARIIVGEAATIGLLAGVVGVALAGAAAATVNFVSARYLPDFPYKPDNYFDIDPGLVALALLFAVGCCTLGSLAPARRAARLEPSELFG